MPRHAKGPRLYLRRGRIDNRTGAKLPDIYFIRDGSLERSTGFGPDGLASAETELGTYIASKSKGAAKEPTERQRRSDPDAIYLAEVLGEYLAGEAQTVARPADEAGFVVTLDAWWGALKVSDVRTSTCKAYVEKRCQDPDRRFKDPATAPRVSAQAARRELEVLSATIGHWDKEYHLARRPAVWLPERPETSRDALTRSQAAAILWAALGHRKGPDGRWTALSASAKANRRHLRRFLLLGLYTGSRPGVLTKLLWEESATQAWVNLGDGVIYRRGRGERDHRTKRRPVVRAPRRLLAHLQRWKAADDRAMAAAAARATAAGEPAPAPLVAVIHHGGAPIAGKIRTGFEGIVRDAGLAEEITPHWMRHTCATWLMEAGVDLWAASAFTGMTPEVLQRVYGHHRPDHQAAARKALG